MNDEQRLENTITVRIGTNRSHTVRNIHSAVDDWYANGSNADVPSEDSPSDEDRDGTPDSGGTVDVHVGEADSEPESGTDHTRDSGHQTEPDREEADEGATGISTDSPEQTGGPEVEQTSVDGTEPEGQEGEGKFTYPEFYFAPGEAVYGDRIN